jgi:hypothetical protein
MSVEMAAIVIIGLLGYIAYLLNDIKNSLDGYAKWRWEQANPKLP